MEGGDCAQLAMEAVKSKYDGDLMRQMCVKWTSRQTSLLVAPRTLYPRLVYSRRAHYYAIFLHLSCFSRHSYSSTTCKPLAYTLKSMECNLFCAPIGWPLSSSNNPSRKVFAQWLTFRQFTEWWGDDTVLQRSRSAPNLRYLPPPVALFIF